MRAPATDRGVATPIEMIAMVIATLAALVFLGFLGRLHAAGVQVTNVAQAAARAASLEVDAAAAERAAVGVLGSSPLRSRCQGGGRALLSWSPSPSGEWRGGSVTVTVECRVRLQSLTTLWVPGSRSVITSDTQPIDRYQR
jgi:Flp pilus assembly protein TadG